ncbi:hypothetical protein Hypma_005668 [Hypsizygus marmoreus]|uniref:F-box domain-containing protein n=1 Tax=Hypsizygus marmoreus TaxID=39966 RepID=A0A369K190_HYPMA|nr:hypothetical protein Hypma_005668 [Hypsizygus marmoreus]
MHDLHHSTSHIDSIPNELLIPIFKYVYADSCLDLTTRHDFCLFGPCTCSEERKVAFEWTRCIENFLDPNLFPIVLLLVCRKWRSVAESISVFWTRIVIFVDSNPTPLPLVRSFFECSRDLPFDVTVMRRPETYGESDADEYKRCRAVIDIMMPHVSRCSTIKFDVIHSSSLPSISKDFHGLAPKLTELHLLCRIDDGVPSGPRSQISSHQNQTDNPFSCPALTHIEVDGRNFAHAYLDLPSWRQSLQDPTERSVSGLGLEISVTNFAPNYSIAKDFQYTLHDFLTFLESLPYLRKLSLANVIFPYHTLSPLNDHFILSVSDLALKDLSNGFFTVFTAVVGFDSLYEAFIENCALGSADVPPCDRLVLSKIDASESLWPFLMGWGGSALDVRDCPSLDDTVLQGLRMEIGDAHLFLRDCPNFTVKGLKKLVRNMNRRVTAANLDSHAFEILSVDGTRPEVPPSIQELEWFDKYVDIFTWEGVDRSIYTSTIRT